MHITEEFLREAIQVVRNVMGFNTKAYTDSDIMGMKGDVISALVQSKTAIWIHENEMVRRSDAAA